MSRLATAVRNKRASIAAVLVALAAVAMVQSASAQHGLYVSAAADFSSQDRLFSESDVIHIKVVPGTRIDLTAVTKSEFELESVSGDDDEVEGVLEIRDDGSFVGHIALSELEGEGSIWYLSVSIEDAFDNEYTARTALIIRRHSDDPETVRVHGFLEVVTETSITVSGREFALTDETEIHVDGDADAELNDLVGQHVLVVAERGEDGEYVAISIEAEDEEDETEIEVEGVITAVSDHSVAVEGIEFIITDETEIEGDDDDISLDALHTGLYVEANGRIQNDGSVVATRIKVEENEGDRDRISIRGEIAAINGSAVTVGETTFHVAESTRIRSERGAELDLDGVEVGMFARARLESSAGGDLVAIELKVEHRFESDDVTIAGRIEAVAAAQITVHGITFQITDDTDIENIRGESVTAENLAAGDFALVDGERTGSGRYVAFEIRVRSRIHHEGGFGGVVTDISDASISVNGAPFVLSAETIVKGVNSVANISVGDLVRMRYRVLGDGSRLAIRIRVNANVEADTELSGIVEDAASGVVNVAGVDVFLTAATRVRDERGRPIASSSVEPGQMISVSGTSTPAGVVAAAVNVQKAVVVAGTVSERTAGRFVVANSRYQVDDETLFVGRSNAELQAGELEDGAFVEIIAVERTADQSGDDVLYAERVLVMKTNEGTAREDDPTVASSFRLEQNYPNPFNPSTTIRFEVGSLGDREVSLTIFDVLGRKVRTLVDASLSSGTYSYTWDGTDAGGRPAASGIYLYRLEIGRQTATRSMTLVK